MAGMGYPDEDATWEPYEHMKETAERVLKEFYRKNSKAARDTRQEADLEKAANKAAPEAAKHQRAQTSKLYKSVAKTSHQRHPTKRSQTKPQKAASPIDIPSDSTSYYEIENESDDCSESPILTTPATPPPPHIPTPGPSTNPRTPRIQRQLSGMPPPSISGVRRSLRFQRAGESASVKTIPISKTKPRKWQDQFKREKPRSSDRVIDLQEYKLFLKVSRGKEEQKN
ncbi:hypothetical protein EV426DRAFT_720300 [Tirmania nivea]|nr:hypothetical protein EV426DRAFT_720300 [Tirmania nivea]